MNTMNVEITVPDFVNWIAIDEDGRCWGYATKPANTLRLNQWFGKQKKVATVLLYHAAPPKNWKEELYTWG